MYEITERCFGILVRDAQQPEVAEPIHAFLCDVVSHILEEAGEDPSDVDFDDVENLIENVDGQPYYFSSYSGSGEAPVIIGFGIDSWAASSVRDDPNGTKGIISTASTPPTSEERQEWITKWDEATFEIRHLLQKHGLTPDVVWTTSTS